MLRLFSWSPPAISLGYAQRSDDVDFEACRRRGIDATRRLTGGRAVLHDDELTYGVVVEADRLRVGRSVTRAYALLCGGLIEALAAVGIEVAMTAAGQRGERDPACFASALGGDLAVGGRKLVGSAQCHRHGGILQHGAIPRTIDDQALADCLRRPAGRREWTCLAELGVELSAESFASHLADGYAELLGGRAEIGAPSAEEWAGMRELAAKYAGADWVRRL